MIKVLLLVALAAAAASTGAIPEAAPVLPQYVIVVMGGLTSRAGEARDTRVTEVYNVTTNQIKRAKKAPLMLGQFGSVVVNNSTIYTIGGGPGPGQNRVWSYDVAADKWNTNHSDLPQALVRPAVVVLNNVLYSIGGSDADGEPVNTVYSLDLKQGANAAWTTLKLKLPFIGGDCCALTTSNGSIFFYNYGRFVRSDDKAQTWTNLNAPIRDVVKGACALIDEDTIFMAGGILDPSSHYTGLASAQIYSISKNQWSEAGNMQYGRHSASAVTLPPGGAKARKVAVCGGIVGLPPAMVDGRMHKSCEVYDANANTWQYGVPFNMTVGRQDFGLHLATLQ